LFAASCAYFWTSYAGAGAGLLVHVAAGPLRLAGRFILPWSQSLPEFLTASRPSDRGVGPTPLSFLVPPTVSPWPAPSEAGCPIPPRFRSQVFSTSQRFPSQPELRGLVSCRNRSWDSSLQSFPLARIAYPSRGRLLPCRHPPAWWSATPGIYPTGFADSRALTRSRLVPPVARAPFPCASRRTSRSPETPSGETAPLRQLHRLRSLAPLASPFAPAQVSPSRRPMLSWVSAPLEPHLHASDPLTHPHPEARVWALVRRLGPTTSRTSRPRRTGETAPIPKHGTASSAGYLAPLEASPDHLSVALLLP